MTLLTRWEPVRECRWFREHSAVKDEPSQPPYLDTDRNRPPPHVASETASRRARSKTPARGHPELSRVPHARRRPKWIIH